MYILHMYVYCENNDKRDKNMHGVIQENVNSCSGEKKYEKKMNACGPIQVQKLNYGALG